MTIREHDDCGKRVRAWEEQQDRTVRRTEKSGSHSGVSSSPKQARCVNDWNIRAKVRQGQEDRVNRVFEWVRQKDSREAGAASRELRAWESAQQTELLRPGFVRLAEQWRKETRFSSSATEKILHPAYQSIIAMGRHAVPLVLEELKSRRGHWFWALHFMTGANPLPAGANIGEAREAWLRWGTDKGLLT